MKSVRWSWRFCTLLGIQTNSKTQDGSLVGVLGITYNFKKGLLMVTEMRRATIIFEIVGILSRGSLLPKKAAKLRGRLGFGASHLSGRHGTRLLAGFVGAVQQVWVS